MIASHAADSPWVRRIHDLPPMQSTMPGLRVVLVVHSFYPEHIYGTEAYTLTVAGQLRELGHDPVVVTARSAGEPGQASEIERYTVEGIPVHRIDRNRTPSRNARDDYHMPALRGVFERLLTELRPDVVHVCHLGNATTALLEVTAQLKIPSFATLTDFYNICLNGTLQLPDGKLCRGPDADRLNCMRCGLSLRSNDRPNFFWTLLAMPMLRGPVAWLARRLATILPPPIGTDARAVVARPAAMRAAMGHYRAAIAPSSFLKRIFEANGTMIPLIESAFGVDIDRRPKPVRSDRRVRFGFMGQLLWHKGVHLLMQALRHLPSGSFSLDIWGSEELDPAYAEDLCRISAGMDVSFHGTFPEAEMANALADIDVLVLPSTWFENSPLTLLKALATHTPVVVSDVPGMTAFIQEGVDGFAFPRGDETALTKVLLRFVEEPGLAHHMSLNASYLRTERDMVLDLLDLYRRYGVGMTQEGSSSSCG